MYSVFEHAVICVFITMFSVHVLNVFTFFINTSVSRRSRHIFGLLR